MRTQLPPCLPRRGVPLLLTAEALRCKVPRRTEDGRGRVQGEREREAGICPRICLIGFDFHNYRVIMLSLTGCEVGEVPPRQPASSSSSSSSLVTPLSATEAVEQGRVWIDRDHWLSSGYWVLDRTPGDHASNNDWINVWGAMRMSEPRGTPATWPLLPGRLCSSAISAWLSVCVYVCEHLGFNISDWLKGRIFNQTKWTVSG